MRANWLAGLTLCALLGAVSTAAADETVRNYGAANVDPSVQGYTGYTAPPPAVVAGQSAAVVGDPAAAAVAFGHRRRCCGGGYAAGYPSYGAYGTYQPQPYVYAGGNYGLGYYGAVNVYGAGYAGYYGPATPNPYGYYQNGQIWGSSGPTYGRPFPVWDSPSGVYDYRYRGWGSYGWGGWGGTGPAGWGYQGGFYW